MAHFLLRFNRQTGKLQVSEFVGEGARRRALSERFRAEAERVTEHEEIVVLEAGSLAEIKRTHRRYFRSLRDMTSDGRESFLRVS
jgi:hypothetical protein